MRNNQYECMKKWKFDPYSGKKINRNRTWGDQDVIPSRK